MGVGGMPSVLHLLEIFLILHLGIEKTVLVNVLLVLDLLTVGKLRQVLLVSFLKLRLPRAVLLLRQNLLFLAALTDRLIVFRIVMRFQIVLRVGDQLCDLVLVLGLHRFRLVQSALGCSKPRVLFLFRVDLVFL